MDVELIEQRAGESALELALAGLQLTRVAAGERPPLLRLYAPSPTVAFSRRETLLPGFAEAVAAARRKGFEPVVRAAGGRVAAYHEGCLVIDEIMPATDSMAAIRDRFEQRARDHALALSSLGIDAHVGELPGEYCPGEFSINARGAVKLAGSAQRVVRGAWLLATVVVVTDADPLRSVLEEVQAAFGVEWEPATVGAIADEADLTMADVGRALLAGYEPLYRLVPASLAEAELVAARAAIGRHLPGA